VVDDSERADRPARAPGDQPREREEERQRDRDGNGERDRRPFFRRPAVLIIGGAIILVLVIGLLLWWWYARAFESTDDAFIDARIVRVSPRIAGQVIGVYVNDNQFVRSGAALVDIDKADARAALDQALAQQAQAETALTQAQVQIQVAEAQYRQAQSALAGVAAEAQNAAKDLQRYYTLRTSNPKAVAQGQIDQAEAAARNTAAQRDAARAQAKSAEAQIAAARAAAAGAQARIETARAQVAQARLNLGYTYVAAPVAGHVARRTVAVGTYVAPGQQMLAVIPLEVWVTANFKETQLARMQVGQATSVHIDACPGANVRAHVDSIQRGAGQAFALLPPENATGNYVKVVQRVPVKILLEETPRNCPLGPGMSVEPKVRVR
jgi:membrane fusion protein (multidrug efflux system)